MIDEIDRKILAILQDNARTPNSEIAEKIGMAPSATYERVRKLERKGIIKGYEVRLDADQLGAGLIAFVAVKTGELAGEALAGPELVKIPEVQEVYNVAGEDCYFLKVRARNTADLNHLLRKIIGGVPSVRSTRTTIVLETHKETSRLSLSNNGEVAPDRDR
ncbi:MAG: Lrp/AsnC family transcriptional regulator [candidate division Zixibacteria bacterium]|nr:Lrp/AsnC family transcriptional regulator [candidate division Zixibacteria bacterium]